MSNTAKIKLAPQIKMWCEWHLINFRKYKKDIASYKVDMIPSAIANYGISPRGNGAFTRTTEQTTLHILADRYVVETQVVIDSVEFVLNQLEPDDRELLEMVYLNPNNRFTPEGAAIQLCMSKSTAYRRINNALAFLAMTLGYIPVA